MQFRPTLQVEQQAGIDADHSNDDMQVVLEGP